MVLSRDGQKLTTMNIQITVKVKIQLAHKVTSGDKSEFDTQSPIYNKFVQSEVKVEDKEQIYIAASSVALSFTIHEPSQSYKVQYAKIEMFKCQFQVQTFTRNKRHQPNVPFWYMMKQSYVSKSLKFARIWMKVKTKDEHAYTNQSINYTMKQNDAGNLLKVLDNISD